MATNIPTPQPSSELPPVTRPTQVEDPEVVRLRGEVARHSQTIRELTQRVTAPPQQAAQTTAGMSQADIQREFYRDPVNNTAAIAARVMDDRLRGENEANRSTLIQLAKDSIRAKDPALFDKYYLEIQTAVDSVAPQFHGNVVVWENAFKLVKGNHIDEIIASRQQQPPAEAPRAPAVHIREGGPASPSMPSAGAPSSQDLSQDEKRTARKLGLSDDQYKMGKQAVEDQNDSVRDPVGKSSWDKLVTFDTRERNRARRAAAVAARGSR